jgi:hypothetical protein
MDDDVYNWDVHGRDAVHERCLDDTEILVRLWSHVLTCEEAGRGGEDGSDDR